MSRLADSDQRRLSRCVCVSDVSRVYLGCISGVSRMYLGCISGVSRVHLGCISGVSRMHLGCISEVRIADRKERMEVDQSTCTAREEEIRSQARREGEITPRCRRDHAEITPGYRRETTPRLPSEMRMHLLCRLSPLVTLRRSSAIRAARRRSGRSTTPYRDSPSTDRCKNLRRMSYLRNYIG